MNTPAVPVTKPNFMLAILNLLAFAIMIVVNALSIFLSLNGRTRMQLSA